MRSNRPPQSRRLALEIAFSGTCSVLLRDRARLPRNIPTSGFNGQVFVAHTDDEWMPTGQRARLECDQILVTKFVDQLTRHLASLRDGADDERPPAGPFGQIAQRASQ